MIPKMRVPVRNLFKPNNFFYPILMTHRLKKKIMIIIKIVKKTLEKIKNTKPSNPN